MSVPTYQPRKQARSVFVPIRNMQYHVREWGDPGAPLLFMAHGWMDVSASFQFVVDALQRDWHVVAFDWRGFGLSASPGQDCFWMLDYQADLDALLRHYSPDAPVDLVGHSMGGNVTTLYAGYRPERVRRLVNLEGIGMSGHQPEQGTARVAQWLDVMAAPARLSTYVSRNAVAARLCKTNPRLTAERAAYLALHWSCERDDGRFELLADAAHKIINPYLYRVDEVVATWSAITAPVLWVLAADSNLNERIAGMPDYNDRLAVIRHLQRARVDDAGHMLHHDQPGQTAALIEGFCTPD